MDKKVILIILDGYGEGKNYKYNAVSKSNTPYINKLRKDYPNTLLKCDGEEVGLPKGTMGGSEVGHFTMGAGRIVYQSLEEINKSIKRGDFFKKRILKKTIENCKKNNSKLHLLGMISDAGVHSHLNHLFALLELAKKENLKKVYIHAITDGRDVPEKSAEKFIKKINSKIKELKLGKIASIIGRYYAMDRDSNEKRTEKAFQLYTKGKGEKETNAISAIKNEYKNGRETDYYIEPIILEKDGIIEKEDSIIFFNYRSDRAKQLTDKFTKNGYKNFVCFGPYSKKADILFQANKVKNNLSEILSKKEKTQLRIAETEKYAHVTFFFNSQIKEKYKGEKRIIIPSPKVQSYDQKPEMSAKELTKVLIKELKLKKQYDLTVVNFANCDLVGHSANFEATKKAIETLDKCLSEIIPIALTNKYTTIITADHGNAELMKYANGEDCPAHSNNPVIFMLISREGKKINLRKSKKNGLKDIAPTILEIMKIKQSKEMTGKSLLKQST